MGWDKSMSQVSSRRRHNYGSGENSVRIGYNKEKHMQETERLERYRRNCGDAENKEDADEQDEKFSSRILKLLDDSKLDEYCMGDAYYYDYSVLPESVREKFHRDMYLIFGITTDGEIVSKWVERDDLDKN